MKSEKFVKKDEEDKFAGQVADISIARRQNLLGNSLFTSVCLYLAYSNCCVCVLCARVCMIVCFVSEFVLFMCVCV